MELYNGNDKQINVIANLSDSDLVSLNNEYTPNNMDDIIYEMSEQIGVGFNIDNVTVYGLEVDF